MMGALMDKMYAKHHNKNGKFRPWLLRAAPLLAITSIVFWTVPVSYTHLDVYKRQVLERDDGAARLCAENTVGYDIGDCGIERLRKVCLLYTSFNGLFCKIICICSVCRRTMC